MSRGALRLSTGQRAGVLLILGLGMVFANPVLLLLAVVAAAAHYLLRWLPADVALVCAVVGVLTLATAVGVAASVVGVDLLAAPAAVAAAWSALVVVLVLKSSGGPPPSRSAGRLTGSVAQLPAFLAAMTAVVQSLDVSRVTSWAFRGTDFVEHAVMTAAIQRVGLLDYGADLYPRGAHMLLALVSVPGLPEPGTADFLAYNLQLMGGATWLALAAALSATSAVVLRVARIMGIPAAWGAGAALSTGVVVLCYGHLMFVFTSMAAAPGLLAVLVLLVVPLLVLAPPSAGSRWLLITGFTVCSLIAVAHLWPALLPVPAMAWIALHSSREIRHEALTALRAIRRSSGALALAGGALLVSAALTWVPVAALLDGAGLEIAAIEGELPAPNVVLMLAGMLSLAVVARRVPGGAALMGAGIGLIVVMVALLVGAGAGLDFGSYYPRKGLWFSLMLLLPFAGGFLAALLHRAVRTTSPFLSRVAGAAGPMGRVVTALVALAAFVAYGLAPVLSLAPVDRLPLRSASADDTRRFTIAMDYPQAHAPAVVVPVALGMRPIPTRYDSYVISKLLRLRTGQPQTHGEPERVCQAVDEVAQGEWAVVLTDLDSDVLARSMVVQGCGGVEVVQVPGGNDGAIRYVQMRLGQGESTAH